MIAQGNFDDDRGVDSFYEVEVRNAKLKVMDVLEHYLERHEVPGWKLFDHYMEHSDPTLPFRIRTDKILQKTLPEKIDLVIDHMRENQTKRFAERVLKPNIDIKGGVSYPEYVKIGFKIFVNEKRFKVRVHRYESCPKMGSVFNLHAWKTFGMTPINTDGLKFKQPFKSAHVNSFTFWCETSKNGKFKILNVAMEKTDSEI